jgi:hypothetical protein
MASLNPKSRNSSSSNTNEKLDPEKGADFGMSFISLAL